MPQKKFFDMLFAQKERSIRRTFFKRGYDPEYIEYEVRAIRAYLYYRFMLRMSPFNDLPAGDTIADHDPETYSKKLKAWYLVLGYEQFKMPRKKLPEFRAQRSEDRRSAIAEQVAIDPISDESRQMLYECVYHLSVVNQLYFVVHQSKSIKELIQLLEFYELPITLEPFLLLAFKLNFPEKFASRFSRRKPERQAAYRRVEIDFSPLPNCPATYSAWKRIYEGGTMTN